MSGTEWNEKIDALKEEILTTGRFDGEADLWDLIPAICRAIGELRDSTDDKSVRHV